MTIVRCPRCRDEVTVPAGASKQALVRCPLCLEQYRLEEAVGGVPPALVVIADEGRAIDDSPAEDNSERSLRGEYAATAEKTSDRLFETRPGVGAASPSRPLVYTPRQRPKEKSMVAEMLKIAIGGATGLALGLLVLWWGFGQDIGDLGPSVARYAPWIVPEQLRGNPDATALPRGGTVTADTGMGSEALAPSPPSETRATGSGTGLQLDSRFDDALRESTSAADAAGPSPQNPTGGFGERPPLATGELDTLDDVGLTIDDPLAVTGPALAGAELDVNDKPESIQEPSEPLPPLELDPPSDAQPAAAPSNSGTPLPAGEPISEASIPDLTDLLPNGDSQDKTSPDAEAPASPTGPPEATTVASEPTETTTEQLNSAVAAAQQALKHYDEMPRDDKAARQQAFTDLYLTGSEMGRFLALASSSEADSASTAVPEGVQAILDSVAGNQGASKTSAVKFLASQHWPERKHGEGFFVAGIVRDVQTSDTPEGPSVQMTLDASVRDRTLTIPIVSMIRLPNPPAEGDELVVVGRVVEDPKSNLPGYEGDTSRVLLYGQSVTVSRGQ